jgi:hypothetical protein
VPINSEDTLNVRTVDGLYFVSYSRVDGVEFVARLKDQLRVGIPPHRLWVDIWDGSPGQNWDDEIPEAIQTSAGLLFVMTVDSVKVNSHCKDEWAWALKHKKPIIPLRLHSHAVLPFRLTSRQYIDFSGNFDKGLAQLRIFLGETKKPKGKLRELRYRLTDLERELPRADSDQQPQIEQEMRELRQRIMEAQQQQQELLDERSYDSTLIPARNPDLYDAPFPPADSEVTYRLAPESHSAEWKYMADINLGTQLAKHGDSAGAQAAYQRAIGSGHSEW